LQAAKQAGLRYIREIGGIGITRKRAGSGFQYFNPDGRRITVKSEINRINSLVIPPAWTDVWICPNPSGHVQAVGRDARGRKQYRYHPEYRQVRDQNKFDRMTAFVDALPKIRRQVGEDLKLSGLPKRKVIATVVRLLETTCMRVGNDEYARDNGSFGLTTLRDRHVEINGKRLKFNFRGKSGLMHEVELTDRRLATIVRHCQDIPGYELFQYLDDDGQPCRIDSSDVNEYLREVAGQDFTAKDFRTWSGTVLAAQALSECEACEEQTGIKKNIVAAVKTVAGRLGNRPATCRKYYVHPAIFDAYSEGILHSAMQSAAACSEGLRPEESCVIKMITKITTRVVAQRKAS
jgi:DNA topoisomerase-1